MIKVFYQMIHAKKGKMKASYRIELLVKKDQFKIHKN